MNIKELVRNIHKSVEDLDLVTARKYIEENLSLLNDNKSLLKGNARELLDILANRLEEGHEPLSRSEMATINAINSFASKFDVRSIKVTIKNKEQLLLRKDFADHLTADAKIILQGMGAITK
ncbi:hypothetical protein D0469_04935 [Peribacillus saganii]|uniref:Uncharacterized protein n=1 Tax=Peribacillus saganii TaxID=2303992 RepID=A0A372LRV4_9BACI|nr:hypothetical protein [Peribacillus saganii]RFU70796.1 hypothetical protein D0469_04935 [Peribacillus saganii]